RNAMDAVSPHGGAASPRLSATLGVERLDEILAQVVPELAAAIEPPPVAERLVPHVAHERLRLAVRLAADHERADVTLPLDTDFGVARRPRESKLGGRVAPQL